ncbi:MAG: M14 family zinc carboxypeptidase [Planctomycetota bacterium]|jgi:protein MpaA
MKLSSFFVSALTTLTALLVLSGCTPTQSDPYAPVIQSPQQFLHTGHEILGHSVQQRPIEMYTLGSGDEKVLIVATIHGNEEAGTPLVHRLRTVLNQRKSLLDGRTVQIIPVANPDGYVNRTRGNAHGIDLNRNFPAGNRINNATNGHKGITEPESQILHDLVLQHKPDRIVSIHQPLYCLDYDGPGGDIARHMGIYCSLPVKKLGSRPGSMGSFVGVENNIPIITMELARSDSNLSDDELWNTYGPSLLAAITYPDYPY